MDASRGLGVMDGGWRLMKKEKHINLKWFYEETYSSVHNIVI